MNQETLDLFSKAKDSLGSFVKDKLSSIDGATVNDAVDLAIKMAGTFLEYSANPAAAEVSMGSEVIALFKDILSK